MTRILRFKTYNKTIEINFNNSTYTLGTTHSNDTNKNYIITSNISLENMQKDLKRSKFKRIKGENQNGRRNQKCKLLYK